MKNFKQVIIPLLIMLTLSVSIYSCVMVLEVSDNVEKLQEAVNKNKDEFIFLCKPKKVGSKELKMPKEYF